MCEHCNLEESSGENLPLMIQVDGTKQHYEVYLLDDIENDQYSLVVNGTFSELRIKINYCPVCGKKLNG